MAPHCQFILATGEHNKINTINTPNQNVRNRGIQKPRLPRNSQIPFNNIDRIFNAKDEAEFHSVEVALKCIIFLSSCFCPPGGTFFYITFLDHT